MIVHSNKYDEVVHAALDCFDGIFDSDWSFLRGSDAYALEREVADLASEKCWGEGFLRSYWLNTEGGVLEDSVHKEICLMLGLSEAEIEAGPSYCDDCHTVGRPLQPVENCWCDEVAA